MANTTLGTAGGFAGHAPQAVDASARKALWGSAIGAQVRRIMMAEKAA